MISYLKLPVSVIVSGVSTCCQEWSLAEASQKVEKVNVTPVGDCQPFSRGSRLADGEGFSLISASEHAWGLQKKWSLTPKSLLVVPILPFADKRPSKHNLM